MKFLVPGRPFAAAISALAMAAGAGAWRQPATLAQQPTAPGAAPVAQIFETAAVCMTCHNGLVTPSGEDISFGTAWQSSMMAHSALDPYWQAGVRREIMDHPSAQAAIETECSRCHMPMAHVQAMANGETPSVFANVPHAAAPDPMAIEGVSCSVCHQITSDRLGQPDSFTGHFAIDTTTPLDERRMFGPYSVDQGRTALMRSATGFVPTTASHIQQSELCATCHTLYTRSLDEAASPSGSSRSRFRSRNGWRATTGTRRAARAATCRSSTSRRKLHPSSASRGRTSRGTLSAVPISSCSAC
jgi:hypothetical protein